MSFPSISFLLLWSWCLVGGVLVGFDSMGLAADIKVAQKQTSKKKRTKKKKQPVKQSLDEEQSADAVVTSKKGHEGAGVLFQLGIDSIKWKDTGDVSIEQGGIGIGLGGVYSLGVANCCSLGLGGGYHTVSYKGTNDSMDLTTSINSLFLDVDFNYWVNSSFAAGLVLNYYVFMNGELKAEYKDSRLGESSVDITSADRIDIGLRFKYMATPKVPLGGDLTMINGSFKLKDADEAVKYDGTSLRFFVGYLF